MVILTIGYYDINLDWQKWDSDPMPVTDAMDCVMRFVQSGADAIKHPNESVEVLLLHRVTGITLTPSNT